MVDQEIESATDLSEGHKEPQDWVSEVNGLQSSTETVNTLSYTKYCACACARVCVGGWRSY